jgi:predicted GNAT superfamily acetyltransferase
MKSNTTPVAVAYFTVRVPANKNNTVYAEDAQGAVETYLYGGYGVVDVNLDLEDFDRPAYVVTVRVENYRSVSALTSLVQQQRDRLSSGMYSSTEPKILFAPFADA